MFGARIPQYESTTNVRIVGSRVIAYFPPAALAHIHAEQPAAVHVEGATLSARVQTVASDHVGLVLAPNPQSPIPASSSTSAEIETARVSPAAIAFRTLTRGNR